MQKEQIIDYYETCESDYRLLWDLDHSQAMHAGYWDEHTRSLRDALRRENEILAAIAHIKQGEKVLDAGCGVGGSSIFLAQTYACQVMGITLSTKQVQTARTNAVRAGVDRLVAFEVNDYTCTNLPAESFDVVWALESVCHASDKRLFIKEAQRLLKPRGRLLVADGFIKTTPECKQMKEWLHGWRVQTLDQASTFETNLREEGFENISFRDITKHVMPSSRRLYWYSWPAIPLSKIAEWIGWRTPDQTANLSSACTQYKALKKGLWHYGIFCAHKR